MMVGSGEVSLCWIGSKRARRAAWTQAGAEFSGAWLEATEGRLCGELKTDPAPGPCQASFYYQPARGKTRHAIQ